MRGLRWRFAVLAVLLVLLCGGCSSGSAAALHVHLDAGPAAAPFDAPVHVTVSGLSPAGLVTLQAKARDYRGRLWESAAGFRASAAGTLNLAAAVPVSGSYHVADAAGLLWSLHPAFTRNPEVQFISGYSGFTVRLQVLAGGQVKATATLSRLWSFTTGPSVQTVSRDGIASTLFRPSKIKPGAPAIVVIGGSEGGEDILTAGALAMAGYPTLALGYFKEPGLPRCLCAIPLEYFARAVHWLRAQPTARGRRVVLIGGSRGAEAALLVASYEPHLFDAVVADSPSAYINSAFGGTGAAWTFHGQPLTGAAIPVANIRVPVLLSDGGQDSVWLSAASASTIVQELRGSGDRAPYTNLYYPDAGHAYAGLPPYLSYSGYAFNGQYIYLGGSEQANALAAEQFWPKMIEFINNSSAPVK